MTKYHISPASGRPNICRADKEPCPLKGVNGEPAKHFTDKAEAKAYSENNMVQEYGENATLKRRKSKKPFSYEDNQAVMDKVFATPTVKLNSEIKRPKVEDVPDSAIRVLRDKVGVATKEPAPAKKTELEYSQVVDKNTGINDKKAIIAGYLNNPENIQRIKDVYQQQGYSFNDSSVIKNLKDNGTINNTVLREAIRESETNNNTEVVDILMNAEEAESSSSMSYGADRFAEYTPSTISLDNLDDLEVDEEAPDFLAEDPDFAIDDDEDFDEEDN